jgi:hypothetical protein
LHFRRSFEPLIGAKHFIIHVSADNRFVLYLNGRRIGDGPARGDLGQWRYETFDLAPELIPGKNTLSATVWNFGVFAPIAQMSDRTAFLVEGDSAAESAVNTDARWMVETEPGHIIYPLKPQGFWKYTAVGPGETLRAADYDWDWQTEDTAKGEWVHAASAMRESTFPQTGIASSRGGMISNPWQLVPDTLPAMSYAEEEAGSTVRSELPEASRFPQQPVIVPPNSHVHLLLERSTLTTAYPQLFFSGGNGSRIELTYAESLYDDKQKKGDRNEVGTRIALGAKDLVLPDGGKGRSFEPLWWRTWRYLDIEVATASDPLRLDALRAAYTAYPFQQVASFHSSDPELDKIWRIGWHTVQLDAHETYMDTPYWEQLQYVGDARVEAMITYAVSADDRLPEEAIRAINESRTPNGLTASRYPSSMPQYIPPFSLLWVGMLSDFAHYRSNPDFVKEMIPGTRSVLTWFADYQQSNGLLRRTPYWSFVDWTVDGKMLPSYDSKGQSCLVTLQYIGALEEAAALEHGFGEPGIAAKYQERLDRAKRGVMSNCWDSISQLVADSPTKDIFSQQSNALAVLYDVVPKQTQADLMRRVLAGGPNEAGGRGQAMIPASYYFQYYVARALAHAGLADRYFEILEIWRGLLKLHFTTWPEVPGDTRSDSHAWSAHPTFDLLTIVAGIAPASYGFSSVSIEPHLGTLTSLDAVMPHDGGAIHVQYRAKDNALDAIVDLPAKLDGSFLWKGRRVELHSGRNAFNLSF